jgi:hypothetical protein
MPLEETAEAGAMTEQLEKEIQAEVSALSRHRNLLQREVCDEGATCHHGCALLSSVHCAQIERTPSEVINVYRFNFFEFDATHQSCICAHAIPPWFINLFAIYNP